MIENFRTRLAGWGIADDLLESANIHSFISVVRKGELTSKGSGKVAEENKIFIEESTTYEIGYEPVIDRIIGMFRENRSLHDLYLACSGGVELQIWNTTSEDEGCPSIHIRSDQMEFLNSINAHLDVDIV